MEENLCNKFLVIRKMKFAISKEKKNVKLLDTSHQRQLCQLD